MKSTTTEQFRRIFRSLPAGMRTRARLAYRKWLMNPDQGGVEFKKVGLHRDLYSARIDRDWRALAVRDEDTWIWLLARAPQRI